VSFPNWSEDAPFVPSKKNSFEETLFKSEDERYEMDRIIEMNATTIRNFENVTKKMQAMSPEEAQKFRLQNNLGGSSEVIYHVAIKRLYGEKAQDVLDAIKKHPVIAVPVLLERLRQKEAEWVRAQKEWKKIWADVYHKNIYKALDYQGINFKLNDKKNTTQKTMAQVRIEFLFCFSGFFRPPMLTNLTPFFGTCRKPNSCIRNKSSAKLG